jgi:LPXTG-site transpeptidase (sortase) family protein
MKTAQSFNELYEQLKLRFVPFSVAFFVVVFMTYLVLYVVDFYPEPVTTDPQLDSETAMVEEPQSVTTETTPTSAVVAEVAPASTDTVRAPDTQAATEVTLPDAAALPVSLHFDRLDRTVTILNPESASYAALDRALEQGVVRHPYSADLQDTGNMLILGHSSYLPNVLNRNFQAFNGIERLAWGDIVRVTSEDAEYVYRIDRVYEAPASDIVVPVGEERTPKLTLVTCDVLGAKEDRFIVEASLIETVTL